MIQEKLMLPGQTERFFSDVLIKVIPKTEAVFRKWPWAIQFINFGIVGIANTIIAYSVYAILVTFEINPQIANFFSFGASLLNAYLVNKHWTFRRAINTRPMTALRFITVYGGNYILGVIFLWLYLDVLYMNKYLAPFLSSAYNTAKFPSE